MKTYHYQNIIKNENPIDIDLSDITVATPEPETEWLQSPETWSGLSFETYGKSYHNLWKTLWKTPVT